MYKYSLQKCDHYATCNMQLQHMQALVMYHMALKQQTRLFSMTGFTIHVASYGYHKELTSWLIAVKLVSRNLQDNNKVSYNLLAMVKLIHSLLNYPHR